MTGERRRRLSLRARITGVALLLLVVVLSLASIGLVQILDHALMRQIDDTLTADADGVAQVVRAGNAPRNGLPARYVQFTTAGGKVIGSNDVAQGLPLLVPRDRVAHVTHRTIFSRNDPGLGHLRVIVEPFSPGGEVVLIVAQPVSQLMDTTRSLTHLLELGVPLLTIAMGLVIWPMVGRALRPVDQVRASLRDISARDLSGRVPSSGTGDEIDRLTVTVNEMLARLETSLASEQRFIADASHELRSPIASMRALLETGDPQAPAADHEALLGSLGRLQGVADQLLDLASGDGPSPLRHQAVDLDELVLRQVERMRPGTTLTLDTRGVSGGQVLGDADELSRLVENLASNAARHARSEVEFSVIEDGGFVALAVGNDGPPIAPDDRERVFERFTRLDDARSRDVGGSGLGLSIVARIVDRHGGSITVDDAPSGGARFTVRLPTSHG